MSKKAIARTGVAITGIVAASIALAGCSPASPESSDGPVKLTFQSLAFQDTTVAATKEIVDAWNKDNPDIQVELQQGSWDNVHDQLVTQFQGGTAPDIIHDESADIMGFANQGYLADLSPYLSDDVKKQVSDDVWSAVTTADGKIVAAPTLLQSDVVFANTDAFAAAGVEVPSGDTLSWDDFQSLSTDLTAGGNFGTGWGMKQPTATVMNLALGFDGTFFTNKDGTSEIHVGDNELQVPERIHDMAYSDASLDPVSLTQSGTDVLPGFFGGKYAMYVGGNYVAQQITESAPAGFNWAVLPPLEGTDGTAQAANPQTMSVSAQSKHIEESAKFIDYFMGAENQAKLAQGDWLIPASAAARDQVATETSGENGWDAILKSGESLKAAPFQAATNYPQWKDQYATPALQQYLANSISLDDLKKQLTDGWNSLG
ncbi:MAG: sugar ABC transporter substrate-binding protein [Leifsonia sp.]